MKKLPLLLLCTALNWLAGAPAWARPRLDPGPAQWSGDVQAGRTLTLEVAVTNRSREISRGVLCEVLLEGRVLGSLHSAPDLAPGGQVLLQGNVVMPADLAERWQGKPAREALQLRLAAYRVPDLKPVDLAVEAHPEGVQWIVSVVNQGQAPAPNLSYRLLLDDRTVIQKKLLESLAPGESKEIQYLERRSLEGGKHRLSCIVDPDGELEDADPSNNRFDYTWQAVANKPDLSLRSWSVEPSQGQVGSPLEVRATLANTGEIELFRLPLALRVNGEQVAEKKFYQSLPPQSEAEVKLTWVPARAGQYQLALVCQGQVSPARSVAVEARAGYKLELVSASVPRRSPQGKDWVVDVQLRNSGSLTAEGVKAVLWADGSRAWSARLGEPLLAGQQASLQLRWTAATPGRHDLRIELSGQGAPADSEGSYKRNYTVEVEATP